MLAHDVGMVVTGPIFRRGLTDGTYVSLARRLGVSLVPQRNVLGCPASFLGVGRRFGFVALGLPGPVKGSVCLRAWDLRHRTSELR